MLTKCLRCDRIGEMIKITHGSVAEHLGMEREAVVQAFFRKGLSINDLDDVVSYVMIKRLEK